MKLHTFESRINQIIEAVKGLALIGGMGLTMVWAIINFGI